MFIVKQKLIVFQDLRFNSVQVCKGTQSTQFMGFSTKEFKSLRLWYKTEVYTRRKELFPRVKFSCAKFKTVRFHSRRQCEWAICDYTIP